MIQLNQLKAMVMLPCLKLISCLWLGVIPLSCVLKILKDKALIPHTSSQNPQKESSPNEAGIQSSILIIIIICST